MIGKILPELKKTQVFHRIVQIGLYFTNERHFEGKLGFLELLSIKFESFSQLNSVTDEQKPRKSRRYFGKKINGIGKYP